MLPAVVDPSPLQELELPLPLRSLLSRRGFNRLEDAEALLRPTALPAPEDHFPDLTRATERLVQACRNGEQIAVCGDYDADGMTSTALLLRALRPLGADPIAAIPSRIWVSGSFFVLACPSRDARSLCTVVSNTGCSGSC